MYSHKIGVSEFKKSYQGSFPIITYETRSTTRRKKKCPKKAKQNKTKNTPKTTYPHNMCRVKNMLPNSQWVTEEVKEEIRQYLETNENKNTMIQNLWGTAKAVLGGKLVTIPSYHKKQEKSEINSLILYLK